MPKSYDAPIPIFRALGEDDFGADPKRRYPWPKITARLIEQDHRPRHIPRKADEEDIKALYVLEPMEDMRHAALWAAVQYEDDVFSIDDLFLSYFNPGYVRYLDQQRLWETRHQRDIHNLAEYKRHETAMNAIPGLNPERVRKIALAGRLTPVCWHAKWPGVSIGDAHARRRQRGRAWKPGRRAATWATYGIAWLTGSESAAVQLWNAYGHDTRWGTDDKSGIKLYGATKRRLVKSLVWGIGPSVTPPGSIERPYSPLPSDILGRVLARIQTLRTSGEAIPMGNPYANTEARAALRGETANMETE